MKKLITLVFVLLAAGCTQAPQTDLEGFKGMRDLWQSAMDAKDPAAIAAIHTEDGALLLPNIEVRGRAAIEAFWAENLAKGNAKGNRPVVKEAEVYAQGDLGNTVGTYTVTDAGGATIDEGKYATIWRHVDGKWQIHRAIVSRKLPLAAPEPEPEDEAEVADEA